METPARDAVLLEREHLSARSAVDGGGCILRHRGMPGLAGESGSATSTLAGLLCPPVHVGAGCLLSHSHQPATCESRGEQTADLSALGRHTRCALRRGKRVLVLHALNPVATFEAQISDVLYERSGAMGQALWPQSILTDEPTTALAVVIQRDLLAARLHLRQHPDITVVLLTPDLSPAAQVLTIDARRAARFQGLLHSSPTLAGPLMRMSAIPEASPDLRKDFLLLQGRRVIQAVERLSLTLSAGRALALVGERGSGTTTPTRQEMRVWGRPVRSRRACELRRHPRHVHPVFQNLFSSLIPGPVLRHHLGRPLALHARAQTDMEGLRVNVTPAGQFLRMCAHQRLSVVWALAVQPAVVLADEPVSVCMAIVSLLLILKEDELALLFLMHDSARSFAEETQVMSSGPVAEGGRAEQVIRQPKHPSTRLLCTVTPDPARAARLSGPGDGGEMSAVPEQGEHLIWCIRHPLCRFHPRCPAGMQVSWEHLSARTSSGHGQRAHCFLFPRGVDASYL